MGLVAFFLALNVWLVGRFVYGRWQRARLADPPPQPRRLTGAELANFAWRQVGLVLFIGYGYVNGHWTVESVGLHGRAHWTDSVLAGELAFLGLAILYALLLRFSGTLTLMRATATRGNLRIWPRGHARKWIAAIFIMVFNPFTEEIVMRGILIHHWGLALGSAVLPIVVGFLLNAGLHWYQGWRMQLWHALFFAMVVWLLYSSFGLVAAITAHVLGDVLPIVSLRKQQRAVRRARRATFKEQRA